ncbi:DUF4019 domain-containing protein [Sphingomonas sp.]|uniref:helix-turn-helix domain-containing protein n=1 Tax=Sphingomonas sp. TaxID=28214 RepID=UPI001B0877DA|nr:DUF4019 domain-containing protein [Sphingomonas sp.]MBO9714173.1 DUF4019 domain-containing protein [Sphingomonas sp.]
MGTRANEAGWALTEKEKQTLRLIVRGHDAKSIARSLGLSVHTINERLRDARRKMAVSSSREAARLLLAAESDGAGLGLGAPTPELLGDMRIGEAAARAGVDQGAAPIGGAGRGNRRPWILIGGLLMTLLLGLLALTAVPPIAAVPQPAATAARAAPDAAVVDAALQWLALVDQGRWDESYRATGAAFRKLNTARVWATTSEKVRVPLGAVVSRTLLGQENLPAPPHGYEVVKFRTSFANKADAVETVTLDREEGVWCVVGVTIG